MVEIVSFGEWLQTRRNQLGLTRTGLAQKVGCSPVTIKKIERDERRPSIQIAELLALHLQIPESEQDNLIRRARGEFMPRFGSPEEMSLAEAQAPAAAEDAPRHNLPPQTTPFFGREQELAEIATNLADANCRLLTILGAGGMGKTRLSIEAASAQLENFTDGIVYVALAPVSASEPGDSINPLAGALADALKISFHGQNPPEQQLFNYLRRKEMLIVFDNFEHLLATADFISDLLHHTPDIKILITSRQSVNLQEEWLFVLQGLPFPAAESPDLEALSFSAVQLFTQRAKQSKSIFDVQAELPEILRICQLVGGMPLALELAAVWVRQMNCAAIAQEIETEIGFLTTRMRNVPERHRSVQAVFTYSWQKLSPDEQAVLQKLSAFRGGFERDAAQAVAGASLYLLSGLVDKSLVMVGKNGRYHLHELLRQFAGEKLAQLSASENDIRNRHSHYFLTFITGQLPKMQGAKIVTALAVIMKDIDNLRAAVRRAAIHQPQLFNKSVTVALWLFYDTKGWFLEAEAMFSFIDMHLKLHCNTTHNTEMQTTTSPECLRWLWIRIHLGASQWRLGRLSKAEQTLQQSLDLLPVTDPTTQQARGEGLVFLGMVASYKGESVRAIAHLEAGSNLLQATSDSWSYAVSLIAYGQTVRQAGNYEKAQHILETSQQILNDMNEQVYSPYILSTLGRLATDHGSLVEAEAYHHACLAQRQELDSLTGIAFTLFDLGFVAYLQENNQEAHRHYQQSIALAHEINLPQVVARSLWGLGNLAVAEGDFTTAKGYFQESGFNRQQMVGGLGRAVLGLGEWIEAEQLFQTSLQTMLTTGNKPVGLDALVGLAHVRTKTGQFSRALELLILVQQHPASSYEIKEKVRKLWEELTAKLPPELVAEAEARGRELDLWQTAESLLNELTELGWDN